MELLAASILSIDGRRLNQTNLNHSAMICDAPWRFRSQPRRYRIAVKRFLIVLEVFDVCTTSRANIKCNWRKIADWIRRRSDGNFLNIFTLGNFTRANLRIEFMGVDGEEEENVVRNMLWRTTRGFEGNKLVFEGFRCHALLFDSFWSSNFGWSTWMLLFPVF